MKRFFYLKLLTISENCVKMLGDGGAPEISNLHFYGCRNRGRKVRVPKRMGWHTFGWHCGEYL